MIRRVPYRSLASGTVALALICGITSTGVAQGTCRPADVLSARTVTDFKSLLSSSDSFDVRTRTSLGIAGTAANKVSYVTAANTCKSAAQH